VARRRVWYRNLEHEEAKARYWAVKIRPQWVVTPRKQTNMIFVYFYNLGISDIMIFSYTLVHDILYRMSSVGVHEDSVILKRVTNGITIAKTLDL